MSLKAEISGEVWNTLDLDVLFPSPHKLMMAENISPKIK